MEEKPMAKASAFVSVIGLLTLILLTGLLLYFVGDSEFSALTEDDLEDRGDGNLTVEVEAFMGSFITVTVASSTDREIVVEVVVYDPYGKEIRRGNGTTPFTLTASVIITGDHEILINLTGSGAGVEDIEVRIATPTTIGILFGFSGCCLLPVAAVLLLSGILLAIIALTKRAGRLRREEEIRSVRRFPAYAASGIGHHGPYPYYGVNTPQGFDQRQGYPGYPYQGYNMPNQHGYHGDPYQGYNMPNQHGYPGDPYQEYNMPNQYGYPVDGRRELGGRVR